MSGRPAWSKSFTAKSVDIDMLYKVAEESDVKKIFLPELKTKESNSKKVGD